MRPSPRHIACLVALIAAVSVVAPPVRADDRFERRFAAALHGCEEWILNPKSWTNGPGSFAAAIGLGDVMGLVDHVDEPSLPPPALRQANHYWRLNTTKGAGFVLVVSDRIPMCHITGGGDVDLQPAIETVLRDAAFTSRWERLKDDARGDMASTTFRSRIDPAFSMVVSRAKSSGGRLDRVQVLATAVYRTGS